MPAWAWRCAAWALLLATALAGPPCHAADLVLGPGDRVAVVVFKRADLSGEFRVTPSGALALPFVRNLSVAGLSLAQAQDALVQRLRDDAFLLDPRVTVELVEARPLFVGGGVLRPGVYPYHVGMTVMRAVAAAGGLRTASLDDLNAQFAVGQFREKLRQAQQTIGLAMLRRSRLLAERSGSDDFAVPDGVQLFLPAAKLAEASENERTLLAQRNTSFRSQVEVLNLQLAGYGDEIVSLNEQRASKQRESDLALQESRYLEGLQRQGLAARDIRVTDLQRLSIQLDGERSQIGSAIARARESSARIAETINGTANQRQVELLTAIKEADDGISAAHVSLDESRAALLQARQSLPLLDGSPVRTDAATFTVDRTSDEATVRLAAAADTPLLPGDLLVVSPPNGSAPR